MASTFTMALFYTVTVIRALLVTEHQATLVDECSDDVVQGDTLNVTVSNCDTSLCTIIKSTDPSVKIRFKPKNKVQHLKHRVSAKMFCILGNCIWKGYNGVDETSAEGNVFLPDSKTPAAFPLEPGKEYLYDNSFHVESYFPSMLTTVYWALKDTDDIVACFLLNVKITS